MTTKTEPSIVNVSFDELLTVLMGVEKGTICNCKVVTEPKMNLGGKNHDNQFIGRVKKELNGSFTCGNSYVDRVKKEMKKQGLDPETWVIEPSKVGEHVSKCVTYNENTLNHCFQLEHHEETKPKSHYIVDGQVLDLTNGIDQVIFEQFEKYLPKKSPSRKQEIYGIPDTVNLFSPSVKNIKEITLNHVRYVLQD